MCLEMKRLWFCGGQLLDGLWLRGIGIRGRGILTLLSWEVQVASRLLGPEWLPTPGEGSESSCGCR